MQLMQSIQLPLYGGFLGRPGRAEKTAVRMPANWGTADWFRTSAQPLKLTRPGCCDAVGLTPATGPLQTGLGIPVTAAGDPAAKLCDVLFGCAKRVSALSKHLLEPDGGANTTVRLSAPRAVRHDVAHQVSHVVL